MQGLLGGSPPGPVFDALARVGLALGAAGAEIKSRPRSGTPAGANEPPAHGGQVAELFLRRRPRHAGSSDVNGTTTGCKFGRLVSAAWPR